jgi:hypothetical protein
MYIGLSNIWKSIQFSGLLEVAVLSRFSTRRICFQKAKRKTNFGYVIGWRKKYSPESGNTEQEYMILFFVCEFAW